MEIWKSKSKWFEIIFLIIVSTILFAPIFYYLIVIHGGTDFNGHIIWAQEIFKTPNKVPPTVITHASWQWIVYFVHEIFHHSWGISAFIVTLASVVSSAAILYLLLRKTLNSLLAGSIAISLLLFAPLVIFYPFDHLLNPVGGYIWTNVYHNPTFLLLKPFALLQLFYSIKIFTENKSDWKSILATAIVSAIAVFTKPNYILCLLPALFLLALIWLWRNKSFDWKRLVFGIGLPSLAILIWQFIFTYSSNTNDHISFAPFTVMGSYSNNLFPKFLLSIALPLIITIVYWKESIKDIRMQLGWLGFGMGLIFTYFFAESGSRFGDGNFIWCGEITLFVLFVCSILFVAEKKFPVKGNFGRWLILSSGFLHILIGISFYYYLLFHI